MNVLVKHIHDTLTSGLQLDIDCDTYDALRKAMVKLEGRTGEQKFKSGRNYKWKVALGQLYMAGREKDANKSESWTISLIKANGEVFTKIGIKLRNEGNGKRFFLNITANPTAIMRRDYALVPLEADPLRVLTSPFRALEGIAGTVFSEKDWAIIECGDITLHNIEIAFPLHIAIPKQDFLLAISRLYGGRISLQDGLAETGDMLNYRFIYYPQGVIMADEITGVSISTVNGSRQPEFSLTVYDKIVEMKAKNKTPDVLADKTIWKDHLRVDIRVFPAFMKKLLKKDGGIRLKDWIELESQHTNFAGFLMKKVMARLHLSFLLMPRRRILDFSHDLRERFGKDVANAWLNSREYSAIVFCAEHKIADSSFSAFLKKHDMPNGIGGLVHAMQNAFNLTSSLRLDDLAQVDDINDLAKVVNKRKQQSNFDEWEDLKGKMLTLCS